MLNKIILCLILISTLPILAGKKRGFDGFYMGASLGYVTQDARFSGKQLVTPFNLHRGDLGSSTVSGGGDLRYIHNFKDTNYHMGFQLSGHLLGTNGKYRYLAGVAGQPDFSVELKGRYMVSGVFNIGTKYKSSFPYGKIGLAVTKWEFHGSHLTNFAAGARADAKKKNRHYPGLQLGFGTAFHMTSSVIVNYAFDYILFQSMQLNFPGFMKVNTSPKIARLMLGLSHRW